jgi:hypothetical protein
MSRIECIPVSGNEMAEVYWHIPDATLRNVDAGVFSLADRAAVYAWAQRKSLAPSKPAALRVTIGIIRQLDTDNPQVSLAPCVSLSADDLGEIHAFIALAVMARRASA